VVTFFTGLALVLALAALVLSILLWFGLYESSSSSSSTSPTSMPTDCTCPTEEEVEQVKSELAAVKELFESVKNRSAQNVIRRDSLSQQMSWLQLNLTHLSNDLASLPQERKFVIPNVTVFDGCTKTLPQVLSCNIVTVPSGYVVEPCLSAYAPVEEEGTILLNAECIITGPSIPEGEVISATLEMFDVDGVDQMRCRCSRILDHPGQNVDNTLSHVCSLIATRCPRTIDVNTTLVWQPAK
jgi:hypothetical protein